MSSVAGVEPETKSTKFEVTSSRHDKPGSQAALSVVDESDSYASALAGLAAEVIRIGRGTGPNVVVAAPGDPVDAGSVRYGFPVNAWAHVPDDRVLVAYIHESRPGSQWCGVPLQEGSVYAYAPGSDHVAVAQAGLHVSYAVTDQEQLEVVADHLGLSTDLPSRGQLFEVPRSAASQRLGTALRQLTLAARNAVLADCYSEMVLTAVAGALAGDPPASRHGPGSGIDSREIVKSCIGYAEAVDRVPSVRELCRAAYISERRLRSAFNEEFDCAPTTYFRMWALEQAHRQLRDAEPGERTVTEIASRLGFLHFGRFAGYYKSVYGEKPSATLTAVPF